MAISDKAISNLTLGHDVEQVITDCFQDWQGALEWAIDHVPDPPASTSWLDYGISLFGNLLWAATVFFPPTFVATTATKIAYAAASKATKAFSMIGAAIGSSGSQIGGVLRSIDGDLTSPEGKKYLHDFMVREMGPSIQQYVDSADDWAKKDLLNHMIAQWTVKTKPNPNLDNDAAFTEFSKSAVASHELRRYVWEKFVFPVPDLTFERQKGGLEAFLLIKLQEMLDDYAAQWEEHLARMSRGTGTGSRGPTPRESFQPVIKFKGIPQELEVMYETNRRKISYTVYSGSQCQRPECLQ
jgi:hypothetical protein